MSILLSILSPGLRKRLRFLKPVVRLLQQGKNFVRFHLIKRRLRAAPRRIVIGCGQWKQSGWVSTDVPLLDLLLPQTWERLVPPDSVDALLAEHVWEHLSLDEAQTAASVCRRFLRPGGFLRVAVPDGLHPDPAFRDYVRPGGTTEMGHQVLYDYKLLQEVFASADFPPEKMRLREYHDEEGREHFEDWAFEDGMVHRSRRYDERGLISIILDVYK
jgi:predicted SAM-dependent methyltransferase